QSKRREIGSTSTDLANQNTGEVFYNISCLYRKWKSQTTAEEINHYFKQAPEHLEKAAEKLKDSMYVDNCVASVDSSEELESFQRDSTELLALRKFDLRGCLHSNIESNFDFQDNQQK
ncbi:hypothetical protein TNCV_276101, partial [Trichonephila clavipes]